MAILRAVVDQGLAVGASQRSVEQQAMRAVSGPGCRPRIEEKRMAEFRRVRDELRSYLDSFAKLQKLCLNCGR
jgi:hypothetical protein